MPPYFNLTKQKFNYLTVITFSHKDKGGRSCWICLCDCGQNKTVEGCNLKKGHTKSCGCLKYTHGMSKTKTFKSWVSMKERCHNPKNIMFNRYGGRGIKVCDRWLNSFKSFFKDIGNRPEGFTLDRIDNNKGYFPNNCRWASKQTQANNRSNNRKITINGITKTSAEWAREKGFGRHVIYNRLKYGWTEVEAITKPIIIYRK